MGNVNLKLLKKLRNETQVSLADCRKALEETNNDYQKALEYLAKHGIEKAEKKAERETRAGWIFSYVHHSGRVGSIVDLECETDFVAKTGEFQKLGHEIAMQVASMNPKDVKDLLAQEYIREPGKTIEALVKEIIAKVGENIKLQDFTRFEIGSK